MSLRVSVLVAAVLFAPAQWTSAQTWPADVAGIEASAPVAAPATLDDARPLTAPASAGSEVTFGAPAPANPFTSIGRDLQRFFSKDTATVMGFLAPAAAVAYTWDKAGIQESQQHLPKSFFKPGSIAGSFAAQTGAGVATWAIGRMTGSRRTTEIGGDLVRAQFVSQVLVQGVKFSTRRERPDGSNNHSFPSGHTASAFATATVLERHFGKKAAIAGYSFATYVAVSRMSANKHHLSDVIMGAAVGIAAGRTVTMGLGGATFDLGVAPTRGGAAVMFTRR
jgi:membrane-associated phospholipid phosphatase